MRIFKLLLLSSLFLSPLVAKETATPKKTYVYDKEVNGSVSKTTWTVEEKEKNLHIQGKGDSGETLVITSPPLNTQSFSYQSKNKKNEYYIHREGSQLYARLTKDDKKIQKEFNIGKDLWIQEFDFTLSPFILSEHVTLNFQIVNPKDLSLHEMVLTKLTKGEQVEINGKTYGAVKTKMTLTGFKKMFWKAELWFDEKTGDLIRYSANEGPNTPTSVITLFSKK